MFLLRPLISNHERLTKVSHASQSDTTTEDMSQFMTSYNDRDIIDKKCYPCRNAFKYDTYNNIIGLSDINFSKKYDKTNKQMLLHNVVNMLHEPNYKNTKTRVINLLNLL